MKVKELISLIGNRAIINIHRKDGANLYLSQCSEEYNQSKIEDYFDRDVAKIEIVNSVDKYDGVIRIFVENEKEPVYMSSKEALKDVIPFNFNESSNIEVNMITNECPICGKCSMSISNQYCHEHEYLGENTYEHLLDEILNWPEWKLEAAIKFKLFSNKTEYSVLQYLSKERR